MSFHSLKITNGKCHIFVCIRNGGELQRNTESRPNVRNPCTVLSLVTKLVAGKYIGESVHIKQMHTDGTSHKSTEIVNVVFSILTKNNALRTICLAGDITAEDGTTKYQSLTIVNQFSESGRLLGRWCEKTTIMYTNDPELPSLLAQIPRKESLCVSCILGDTLSAGNCSTACSA